jgi:hypothetical protein
MTEQNKNSSKTTRNTSAANYPNDTKYSLSNPDILKTYIQDINRHKEELMNPKTTLKRKQEIIQSAIDRATSSAGLPKVKIQFSSDPKYKSGGEYDSEKNTGYLGADLAKGYSKKYGKKYGEKHGLARMAGLAYHEARHMEQTYRALQYDVVSKGKNSTFATDNKISSQLISAASNKSLPTGRYQYGEKMRDEIENKRTKINYDPDATYPQGHNVEKDTYVLNRKVYNLLNPNSKNSNPYQRWYSAGNEAAENGIKEDKINEYQGVEKLSAKSLDASTTTTPEAVTNNAAQNTSSDRKSNATDLSKVVALLQNNAATVQNQYGLDVTTHEGLGKAVMQYWHENNLDPKTLKEQLPQMRESELDTASASLAKKSIATAKTKQLAK